MLMSIKGSLLRHPGAMAAAGAGAALVLVMNGLGFLWGRDVPWLLGAVLVTDMAVVGLGILVAAREVLVAERRSASTQARLAGILDSAMDAIITVDEAQRVVIFNSAAEQVFRVRREEALGGPLERFIPQRFRAAHAGHVERFGRTGVTSRKMGDATTIWGLRADGEEFPIEAAISQTSDAGERFYTVILRDVTLRRQAQTEAQRRQQELRELSAQVLEAREDEKTRIARELHDELGQVLTAMKIDLQWLRERLPAGDAELADKAGGVGRMLDQTVTSVRRIAADLRPLMLDDLGLPDAAQWLVDETAGRSGVAIEFRLAQEDGAPELERSVANAVYRALQESLTNIVKHAGAAHAWVMLDIGKAEVRFEVEDDGRGIAPGDRGKARSLGLKGMRERVAYLGGSVEVAPAPRGGTRVRLRVPLRRPANEAEA